MSLTPICLRPKHDSRSGTVDVLCTRRRHTSFDCEWSSYVCSSAVFGRSVFFFSSRRRHTRFDCDWSSDVCSSDLSCPKKSSPQQYAAPPGVMPQVCHTPVLMDVNLISAPATGAGLARYQADDVVPDRKSVV